MTSMVRGPVGVAFKALLISAAAVALGSAQDRHEAPTQFNEFTIAQLQEAMTDGHLTSERLTQYYLDRIFALDQDGPGVNAVIQLNPDAIEIAERADAMRRQGATTDRPAWTTDLILGDHFLFASSGLAGPAGYPIIQVPAGDVLGMPVGISFIGTAFSEATLIKLASGFEAVTHARSQPTFVRDITKTHTSGTTLAHPPDDDSPHSKKPRRPHHM